MFDSCVGTLGSRAGLSQVITHETAQITSVGGSNAQIDPSEQICNLQGWHIFVPETERFQISDMVWIGVQKNCHFLKPINQNCKDSYVKSHN